MSKGTELIAESTWSTEAVVGDHDEYQQDAASTHSSKASESEGQLLKEDGKTGEEQQAFGERITFS